MEKKALEMRKRREQEARGNDFSMEKRCLLHNDLSMAIEADGAMSKSFIHFLTSSVTLLMI